MKKNYGRPDESGKIVEIVCTERPIEELYHPGIGFVLIPDDVDTTSPLEITDGVIQYYEQPTLSPDNGIRAEIARIEATVTPRRMREAALGIDGGWLAEVDARIVALRAELSQL